MKYIIIFLLALFTEFEACSQSFLLFPEGATWKVDDHWETGEIYTTKYVLTSRDTIFQGRTYKVVESSITGCNLVDGPWPFVPSFGMIQDTVLGQIIYSDFHSPIDSVVIMDFNLVVGDTFILRVDIPEGGGSYLVTNLDTLFLAGKWRRKWQFIGLPPISATNSTTNWFIEGIGYGSGINKGPSYNHYPDAYFELSNYCENDTILYSSNLACSYSSGCDLITSRNPEVTRTTTGVHLFSNAGQLVVRTNENLNTGMTFRLYDTNGRLLAQEVITKSEEIIRMSEFPAGIYIAELQIAGNPVLRKKVHNLY